VASFVVGRSRVGGGDLLGGQTQPPAVNARRILRTTNTVAELEQINQVTPLAFTTTRPSLNHSGRRHRLEHAGRRPSTTQTTTEAGNNL
jgi:hypothetical protein